MVSASEYLKELEEIAYNSSKGWKITTLNTLDTEYDKIQFQYTLDSLNDPNIAQEYKNGSLDAFMTANSDLRLDQLISKLAPSLINDIKDCTQNKYSALLDRTHIAFIPLNNFNAFCSRKSYGGEPLDGYIICINHGLYFCLSLISKALLVENISGDLMKYQRDGTSEYLSAIAMYFHPNRDDIGKIFFDAKELSPEAYGMIGAYQSSVSMMILQFIALHEFGHIVNNDLGRLDYNANLLGSVFHSEKKVDKTLQKEFWEAEYLADEFALKSIASRAKTAKAAWANFLAIYLFFKWVADIEKLKGNEICPFHPPPLSRADHLIFLMHKMYGITQEAQEMKDCIDRWSNAWIDNYNDNQKEENLQSKK